jgi:hypothetical protein
MILRAKILSFLNSIKNGLLGILAEIFAVLVLIVTGFLVCMFWWGMFVK